jgi:hypothetical protein
MMSQAPLSARYNTTSTDIKSNSISKVQYNQYGCHKHLFQQGTLQPVRCHKHLYQHGTTQPVRMSQAPLSVRYSTTRTDVTITSVSKVQHNQYGCHKHLYKQGTTQPVRCGRHLYQQGKTQPVRMSQANSISKVQHNKYGCQKHLYQQGLVQLVRMSQEPLSARYNTTSTISQATLSARYNTTSTNVTITSISKVQCNQYGCHKHFRQQGTVQPVRFHKHLY